MHSPTEGSYGGAVSYERGTPVLHCRPASFAFLILVELIELIELLSSVELIGITEFLIRQTPFENGHFGIERRHVATQFTTRAVKLGTLYHSIAPPT